jgi:superfamily II DNA helicase RecQ
MEPRERFCIFSSRRDLAGLADLNAKAHDRIAVDIRHALNRANAVAFRESVNRHDVVFREGGCLP